MKQLLIVVISLVLAFPLSLLMEKTGGNFSVIEILYNALSIIFSIGLGLIITFSLDGIRNGEYIIRIRKNLDLTRNKFIIQFLICTILFIVYKSFPKIIFYNIHCTLFLGSFIMIIFILSLIYFIINFTVIQRLKNEIFDRLLAENKDNQNQNEH